MLKNKVAVIYGAGGAVGSAVARAFGREGATLFLTGRRRASLDDVAKEIASSGGFVETAEVNALDEQSVDKHLRSVIDSLGGFPRNWLPTASVLWVCERTACLIRAPSTRCLAFTPRPMR
jgi:NAD(P)-dependent dehydrogenase (short-subunit alcohol dehydrogenase family)